MSTKTTQEMTVLINGKIDSFLQSMKTAQSALESFGSSETTKKLGTELERIDKKMQNIQTKNNQPNKTNSTFKVMENQVSAVELELERLDKRVTSLSNKQKLQLLDPKETENLLKAKSILQDVERLDKSRKTRAAGRKVELLKDKTTLDADNAKFQQKRAMIGSLKQDVNFQETWIKGLKDTIEKYKEQTREAENYKKKLEAIQKLEKQRSKEGLADKDKEDLDQKINEAKAQLPEEVKAPEGDLKAYQKELKELREDYQNNKNAIKELQKEVDEYDNKITQNATSLTEVETELKDNEKALEQLKYKLSEVGASGKPLAEELGIDLKTINSYDDLRNKLNELYNDGLSKADDKVTEFRSNLQELKTANERVGDSANKATEAIEKENTAMAQVDNIKQRIQAFLGLEGAISIARGAMRNAYETVKELDAAMTEMAVVTDLDVGDYWEQIPDYTKRANELGVAIKDTYEAATLYYQQGLKTNEVTAISTKTLQMARIAGLSAEDATNKMTAALRGFNMELNEASATKIADVYSELAAITASDVDEISSAMTKTASIAASAGMEFETTAAFLSQIIETTRESAETAGTALKTVVARFQELKKDPSEIGEVDGEVVDANKIETALRSVGVSLRDTNGQFRDLDDVFLELAAKWNTLDKNTQRYVATIAAGSRQQSRFIAMMSDYARTQELVSAANNSAGASTQQFEKTLESLDSKLKRLKNAWDSFTMGIMDDGLIKLGIDTLTTILELVNNITDALPGLLGSFAKIGIVIGGLSLGKKGSDKFLGYLGDAVTGKTKEQTGLLRGFFEKLGGAQSEAAKKTEQVTNAIDNSTQSVVKNNNALKKGIGVTAAWAIAIAAVVAAITYAYESWKKYSEAEERALKELDTAASGFRERAESARDTLSDIANEKNNLQELQNTFNDLTKGTAEWKQSLVEVNSKVLELTEKYPELMQYVKMQENGALGIQEAGWASVAEQQQKQLQEAMYGQTTAQLQKNNLQQQMAFENKYKTNTAGQQFVRDPGAMHHAGAAVGGVAGLAIGAKVGGGLGSFAGPIGTAIGLAAGAAIGGLIALVTDALGSTEEEREQRATGGLTADDYNKYLAKLAESGVSSRSSEDEFEKVFDTMGFEDAEFDEVFLKIRALGSEFDELSTQMLGYRNAQDAMINSLASTAAQDNKELMDSKYYASIVNASGQSSKEEYDEMQKKIDEKMDDKDYVDDGEPTEKLMKEYANVSGRSLSDIEKMIANNELTAREMVTAIEQEPVVDSIKELQKNVLAKMKELSPDRQKIIRGMISEGGQEFTAKAYQQMIEKANKLSVDISSMGEEDTKKLAAALGLDLDALGIDWEVVKNALVGAQQTQAKTAELYNILGVTDIVQEKFNNQFIGLTSDLMEKIFAESTHVLSGDNANAVLAGMAKFLPQDEEEATKYFGLLANLDMTNKDSVEQLSTEMLELGLITEDQVDEFNLLENEMITLAAAVSKVNLDTLTNQIRGLNEAETQVRKGQFERRMTREKAATLIGKPNATDEDLKNAGFRIIDSEYVEYTQPDVNELFQKGLNNLNDGSLWSDIEKYEAKKDKDLSGKTGDLISGGYNKEVLNSALQRGLESYAIKTTMNRGVSTWTTEDQKGFYQDMKAFGMQNILNNLVEEGKISKQWAIPFLTKLQDQTLNENEANVLISAVQQHGGKVDVTPDSVNAIRKIYDEDSYSGNIGFLKKPAETDVKRKVGYDYHRDVIIGETEKQETTYQEIIDGLADKSIEVGEEEEVGPNSKYITQDDLKEIYEAVIGKEAPSSMTNEEMIRALSPYTTSQMEIDEAAIDEVLNNVESILYEQNDPQAALDYIQGQNIDESYKERLKEKINTMFKEKVNVAEATGLRDSFSKSAGDDSEVIDMLTINYLNLAEAATEAGEGLSGFQEILTSSKRNTSEYHTAMSKTIQILNNLFDTDLTTEWGIANQELMEGIVAGNEAAYESLSDYIALQKSVEFSNQTEIQLTTDALQAIEKYIDGLKPGEAVALSLEELTNAIPGLIGIAEEHLSLLIPILQAYGAAANVAADGTLALTKTDMSGFFEGTKGPDSEPWENAYDWLYNYNEKINALAREREQIERRISRLLEDETYNYADIEKQTEQQLKNLNQEAQVQKKQYDIAKTEMGLLFDKNPDLYNYASYDYATGEVMVDYESLENVNWDSERGQALENMLGRVEELRDVMQSSEDALWDIQEETEAIYENARQGASELYDRVKEALVFREQEKIDEYSNLSEAISEAQNNLIDTLQEEIALQRQIRDNQEKSEELADKRTRLAYLKRDTSGVNALEIASLEKELKTGEQDMQDTLVDQAISDLQDSNEKAAEQRQMQIDIAQAQLDVWSKSSDIWTSVEQTINDSLQQMKDGVAIEETSVGKAISAAEGIASLNPLKSADAWKEVTGQAEASDLYKALTTGSLKNTFDNTQKAASNALTEIGKVTGREGSKDQWEYGKVTIDYLSQIASKIGSITNGSGNYGDVNGLELLMFDENYQDLITEYMINSLKAAGKEQEALDLQMRSGSFIYLSIQEGATPDDAVRLRGEYLNKILKSMQERGIKFATGGLADFTGPAWLDGTPSKPEYVLNSIQTQKFFDLVDVAESLDLKELFGNSNKSESKGDSYFDIDINVDSIGEDYDVEQIADKIKQLIYNDATYRNVNAIRRFN